MNYNTLQEPYKSILSEPIDSESGMRFTFQSTYNLSKDAITDRLDFGKCTILNIETDETFNTKYEVVELYGCNVGLNIILINFGFPIDTVTVGGQKKTLSGLFYNTIKKIKEFPYFTDLPQ